jgi:hypothetical protein
VGLVGTKTSTKTGSKVQLPPAIVQQEDLKKKDIVLVQVEGKVDLVHEELAVEIIYCAVQVVCVGMIFKALVHVVKQPCAS